MATATVEQTPVEPPVTLQSKFIKTAASLGRDLVERHDVIDSMILAVLSQVHHFQYGVPGVAKSLSVERLNAKIEPRPDRQFFKTLLTKFSNYEEIAGPLDLAGLEQSRYRYMVDGYLPAATFAFLDEIFKANSAILNALLWMLNEREFRNDGSVGSIPLSTMFCASNELPVGEELNALYDRVQFRLITKPIQEQGNFRRMLQNTSFSNERTLTWDDIDQAITEVRTVVVPDDVIDAMTKVRMDLRIKNIEPTDRRFRDALRIVQAAAWMDEAQVADIEHLRPLKDVLWTNPEDLQIVQSMMLELANPLDKEAKDLLDEVDKIDSEMRKALGDATLDPQARNKAGVSLHNKVGRAKEELEALKKKVDASGRKSAKVSEVQDRLVGVTTVLLTDVFKIPVDDQELDI